MDSAHDAVFLTLYIENSIVYPLTAVSASDGELCPLRNFRANQKFLLDSFDTQTEAIEVSV